MWYKAIKNQLDNLPGEQAHFEMIPYRILTSEYKEKKQHAKLSAVMCLLFEKQSNIYGVLIERQDDGGKHSGQIAFPGGKIELTDQSLLETALRETEEEIGIKKELIEPIGALTPVFIPVSNYMVHPFIGILKDQTEYILCEDEVKSVIEFNLKDLLDEKCKTFKTISNHLGHNLKNVPCFILNDKIVWGATSLILNEIKTILINSELKL
jgi:8-oxo-dGTP pyrophosphatase MutT (NUDIX family)